MNSCRAIVIVPALAALVSGIDAAELVMRDIYLDIELPPTSFSYTLTTPDNDRTGSDSFDSAYGVNIGGRWSFAGPGQSHGPVVGAELIAAQYSYAAGSGSSYGLRAIGGYAYAWSDRWTFSGEAVIGFGQFSLDITDAASFPDFSASGTYLSYGARLSVNFALSDRALIDLRIGYDLLSTQLSGDDVDLDLSTSGLVGAIGFTWRF